MRKAHFIALAQALAASRPSMPPQTFETLLLDVAEVLSGAEPSFSPPQFFAAARAVPFVKRQPAAQVFDPFNK